MPNNIAPEEKLLRLIRGQKKKEPGPEIAAASASPKSHQQTAFILLRQYLTFFNGQKTIKICFAISCIFLLYSFIYPLFGLRKIHLPKVTPQKIAIDKLDLPQPDRPYEFYSEKLKGRPLFGQTAGSKDNSASLALTESISIKDISLLGIISGDNPQAILEDKKSRKTYYVSKGQFVGDFQLEDIQEGKIILNSRGQRYELQI